ncbi:DUF3597 domain-containing protein [Roseibacterium beibuensis]|uniref:DUF3597 domain-containing protein n=1 Tax=[Roseibacterium] beibuensis TaxID=1193142 RepID=UPI00217DA98D|nr:DUF3597 domain-containing protein [Roseibacterium beibuensis]MCS6626380.1 DUF3597 domain-containing protein [Roseibacterium beibuensis]
MGIFSSIWDRIRGHRPKAAPTAPSTPAPQAAPAAAPAAAAPVDVEGVLVSMAEMKGEAAGNWRTSIVDLLKLLGLDSSLEARTELAQELGVNAGPHGSAEQNIALSKAVWRKLEENGGLVPDSLRD